jgi:hypothetical protein
LSQTHAIKAPNMGTVALMMDDKPVVMDSKAWEKQAKGMAELISPTNNVFFQCWRNCGPKPRPSTRGSKKQEAMATRTPAVGRAPNSVAPSRMNKKELPQIAASIEKSMSQGLEVAVVLKVRLRV